MALRHSVLTDLTDPAQVKELNRMLKEVIDFINRGGEVVEVSPRPNNTSLFGGSSSQGPIGGGARFRAVPTAPSAGGRLKLQFHDGKEWVDK